MSVSSNYTEDNIRSLDWKEHIRMRPGMYIGKLGDGSSPDDGIYILLKEVLDNSIDEFVMGAGKTIEISISESGVSVRDYGRGIPLGKVVDVVSKMNTGGKYDSRAFKKSVGLNGVGTKAVNALSSSFKVESCRDGKVKSVFFEKGNLTFDNDIEESSKRKGTKVTFIPDDLIFKKYKYRAEYVSKMLKYYVYLNPGLTIVFNGEKYISKNGLKDLLEDNNDVDKLLYPIIHLKGNDIEIALTHSKVQYSEEYYSFVNGQHTTQGGTHQSAFREALEETGIKKSKLKLKAELKDWYYYDLPADLAQTLWNGKYVGQKQKWYLFEFTGSNKDINVNTKVPEFSEYKWVDKKFLVSNIVPFKRDIYRNILKEFKDFL